MELIEVGLTAEEIKDYRKRLHVELCLIETGTVTLEAQNVLPEQTHLQRNLSSWQHEVVAQLRDTLARLEASLQPEEIKRRRVKRGSRPLKDGERRVIQSKERYLEKLPSFVQVAAFRKDSDTPYVIIFPDDSDQATYLTDIETYDLMDRLQRALGVLPSSK